MTKLQKLRTAAGLSQSQLAAKTGLSVRALQAYEGKGSGSRDFDSARLKVILKVCAALGCSLHEIIEDNETKTLLKIVNDKK